MNTDVINIYSNVILDAGFFKRVADSGITVNFFQRTHQARGMEVATGFAGYEIIRQEIKN